MASSSSAKRVLNIVIAVNIVVIVFATILGLSKTGNPSRYFGEGRFTTGLSCLQLLAVGFFAFQTFRLRGTIPEVRARRGQILWLLIAAGFVFLAADDAFQIHERLDRDIHRIFHLQGSALTDRIDDAIIAAYGLIGVGVLFAFRREMMAFKAMLPALIAGFVVMGLSVFFDAVSNRVDMISWFVADLTLAKRIEGWLAVGDGAFQLLAEGFFVVAFYVATTVARPFAPVPERAVAAAE